MSPLTRTRPSGPPFHEFRSAGEMHTALAQEIAQKLAAAVSRNGRASLIAAGGKTPGPMFDILARCDLPWRNIEIAPTDERWIETSSDKSNENMIRTRLLKARAVEARLVPLKAAHTHPADALHDVEASLARMQRPFDVVTLGMGTDGHIASLIPGSQGLNLALDREDPALVRAIVPTDAGRLGERITLTLRALLASQWIALLIHGEDKRRALQWALGGQNVQECPARAVLRQQSTPVVIYWCA